VLVELAAGEALAVVAEIPSDIFIAPFFCLFVFT